MYVCMYCSLNWIFDRTIFFTAMFVTNLRVSTRICAENIFFSSAHLLQGLGDTETAAFVSFQLLRRRRVCFGMHSDALF